MLCSGQSAVIHSVSLPIAVACNSCLFQNIIVAHFTELNFFKQAWGHHFQPCCVPVFHNASLIRATSGPSGMLQSNARRCDAWPIRHTLMVACTTTGNPSHHFVKHPGQTSTHHPYGLWHCHVSAPHWGLLWTSGVHKKKDLMHAVILLHSTTFVSFIDCHMKYTVLKLFEAGLGSSISTIIVSKVAVARFLCIC